MQGGLLQIIEEEVGYTHQEPGFRQEYVDWVYEWTETSKKSSFPKCLRNGNSAFSDPETAPDIDKLYCFHIINFLSSETNVMFCFLYTIEMMRDRINYLLMRPNSGPALGLFTIFLLGSSICPTLMKADRTKSIAYLHSGVPAIPTFNTSWNLILANVLFRL